MSFLWDYGPIEEFLVGVIGKSEYEAAKCTFNELRLLRKGYQIRNHNMWDIARFIAHEHYMLSPFIDNKETDRRRFFPLPLDEEEEVEFINQKLTEHECSELGRIFGHKIEL